MNTIKTTLNISKRANFLILLPLAVIAILLAIFFTRNWFEMQEKMTVLKGMKINSRIIGLRDLNRGTYEIRLNIKGEILNFDLPIAYEVINDSIAIGDSLVKEKMSNKFEVYRIYEKRNIFKISELIF